MADIRIAAILRAGIFSPNHIASDAAILYAVAAELRHRGCEVNVYSESEFCESQIEEEVIIAMCRGEKTLEKIQRLEDEGRIVVNSGYGIENCVRMIMVRLFDAAGVPQPQSFVVDTDVESRRRLIKAGFGACWVKKGDAPLHHLEDICRCRHPEEAQDILHEFFFRHISRAVVSRDIEGERIRFYGIVSTGWFHCFNPLLPYSGSENGAASSDLLMSSVKEICMKAAETLKVDIFGGDMVVSPEGECYVVNFDDWPSFAPIRKEAAKAIAKSVLVRVRNLSSNKRKKS